MTLKQVGLVFLCCALAGVVLADRQSKTVTLPQVPAAVQKTIRDQLGTGKLGEIERVEEEGEVTYEVTMTKEGRELDLTVADNGTLTSIDVTLDETPPPVQKAIKTQLGQGTLENIEKTIEDGEVTYDVTMTTKGGADRSFTVAKDGTLVRFQVALEETPPAVRKTIESQVGKGKLGDIFCLPDGDNTFYDVDFVQEGKERDFRVAKSGKLESLQMFLSEIPEAVRKTVTEKIGDGKIRRIDKALGEKNDVTYEIEGRKNGKAFDFSVGPKGRFLGMDE